MKLTKQRKYKNGPKANPTFYILLRCLLIFLLALLSNKTKEPKDTSVRQNYIKNENCVSINLLKILDITKNSFLRCQHSYFALANIHLHRYDSFSRFILLLAGDINVSCSK